MRLELHFNRNYFKILLKYIIIFYITFYNHIEKSYLFSCKIKYTTHII